MIFDTLSSCMELHTDDKIISRQSNWVFDEHVAPEFDKHVRKSVPNYTHVQELAETFSDWFTYPSSTVIDFGASTGETLRRIKRRHTKELTLIGYDNSQAMIEQAKHKGIDITFADLESRLFCPIFPTLFRFIPCNSCVQTRETRC